MKQLLDQFSEAWCKTMHPSPMWPIHGAYRCRACHRSFPVEWEAKSRTAAPAVATVALSQAFAGEGR